MISLAFPLISDPGPGPRGIHRLHLVICFAGLYLLPGGLLPASLSGVSSCETNTVWSKERRRERGKEGVRGQREVSSKPRGPVQGPREYAESPCFRRPPGQSPDQWPNGVVALLSSLGLPAPGWLSPSWEGPAIASSSKTSQGAIKTSSTPKDGTCYSEGQEVTHGFC